MSLSIDTILHPVDAAQQELRQLDAQIAVIDSMLARLHGVAADPRRFTLSSAAGLIITGQVQGAGGKVAHLDRIQQAIRQVSSGRPSPLFEPQPGHCMVYPHVTAESDGEGVLFDLRGARVMRAGGAG